MPCSESISIFWSLFTSSESLVASLSNARARLPKLPSSMCANARLSLMSGFVELSSFSDGDLPANAWSCLNCGVSDPRKSSRKSEDAAV